MKPTPQQAFGIHQKTGVDISAKRHDGHYVLKYLQDGNTTIKHTGPKESCYAYRARLIKYYGYKLHLFSMEAI